LEPIDGYRYLNYIAFFKADAADDKADDARAMFRIPISSDVFDCASAIICMGDVKTTRIIHNIRQ